MKPTWIETDKPWSWDETNKQSKIAKKNSDLFNMQTKKMQKT